MSENLGGPTLGKSLELALAGRYDEACALLAASADPQARHLLLFITHVRRRELERTDELKKCRHDVGNSLAIAQASLEGMLDGVVSITEPRLRRVLGVIADVSAMISAVTSAETDRASVAGERIHQPYDVAAAELFALAPLGATKNVGISYTSTVPATALAPQNGAAHQTLRGIFLHAMRGTPPGGVVRVERTDPSAFVLNVGSPAAAHVIRASNGAGRLLADNGAEATIALAF